MILSILFWALAIGCNACMDAILFRFGWSIFKNKDPKFWNPAVSSSAAKQIGGWKVDAWHIFMTMMVAFLALAIIAFDITQWPRFMRIDWVLFLLYGAIWVVLKPVLYGLMAPLPKKTTTVTP